MKWYRGTEDDAECVGDFEVTYRESAGETVYFCPLCGAEASEWEGQIDETEMGQAIYGENLVCYPCGIGTAVEEIEGESDW